MPQSEPKDGHFENLCDWYTWWCFRGLKQITKHLFFLLQTSERCPLIYESAEEEEEESSIYESAREELEEEDKEEEIAEVVPSGLKVTSADRHNQEAWR